MEAVPGMKHDHKRKSLRGRSRGESGFSLLEMMIVCCIMMIVAGIGFMAIQPALKDARVNQAYQDVLMPLRIARQRAIAERKQYIVCFGLTTPTGALTPLGAPTAQSIQIFRWDAGTALSAAAQISINRLPSDMQMPGDHWDAEWCGDRAGWFWNGRVAIDFDQGVAAGNKNQVMFMPDGSAHDTNGSWNSGIVYVARNGDLYSSRAVTLYGAQAGSEGGASDQYPGGPKWLQQ